MNDDIKILLGEINGNFIVKVINKGTMEYCSDLFDYLNKKIEEHKIENVYFDLEQANYVDSSFVGLIVSIQKKMKLANYDGKVIILNCSDKVMQIFITMGLAKLLPFQNNNEFKNINLTDEVKKKLDKSYDDIKLILESHQNLMEINSENRKRFSLVEEMLKKELERKKNE